MITPSSVCLAFAIPLLQSLALALLLAGTAAAAVLEETGDARDPNSGALIYREQHLMRQSAGRMRSRLVLYRCADGTPFARKQVDYRQSLHAPAFELLDSRQGYAEGLRYQDAPVVWSKASWRKNERSAELAPELLVADAGFDEFVRTHWSALSSGQPMPLRFAVPARREAFAFELRRIESLQLHGQAAVRLRLSLDGWLRWLAPAIDVIYARDSRRLLRFEGISNLRDDTGDSQLKVRIDFPTPPSVTSEKRWRALEQLPLQACPGSSKVPGMRATPA